MLDNRELTYDEMRAEYVRRGEGLTEEQMLAHWNDDLRRAGKNIIRWLRFNIIIYVKQQQQP